MTYNQVRNFLIETAPYAHPKLIPSYWETTLLASLYAKVLAEKLPSASLSPEAAEGLNLMHDFGRVMSPDQFYRNDLLMERFANRAGFHDGALDQLPSLKKIIGLTSGVETYEDHTPAQRILHVADWLGKRNADGELVKIEEVIDSSNYSFDRYRKLARWTSTLVGIDALKRGQPLGERIFRDEVTWLHEQGVNLETVRHEVQALSETDANRVWLLDAMNAQEALDPRADAALGRPLIRHVIWDVGGVLFKDSQADLYEAMSRQLGIPKEAISKAVEITTLT